MQELSITIQNKVGLHARPAALFVQNAKRFKAKIRVSKDERAADAKSILGILTLGAGQGSTVTVCADGEDEVEAISTLKQLIEDKFGEPE